MPRHASRSGPRVSQKGTPLERYERLDYASKLICYKYYLGLSTNLEQGWNPDEAGSVFHQRSSNYLSKCGTASWFRHKGKQMVTLAQAFAKANTPVPEPTPPPAPTAATPPTAAPTQAPAPAPTAATAPPPPPRPQPNLAAMDRTPTRAAAGTPLRAPSPGNVRFQDRNQDAVGFGDQNALPVATCFGTYRRFNYTTRVTSEHALVRQILHNGVEQGDVMFEWVNARACKVRVAWPEWFQYAEQMAAFTTDDDGNIAFPPEHQVTSDTAERNQAMVEEDGRVWDDGFIVFERDMRQEDVHFELLEVDIPSKNKTVTVLQSLFQVLTEEATTNRQRVQNRRTVNIGTGARPANPGQTRTASETGNATPGDQNGRNTRQRAIGGGSDTFGTPKQGMQT